MPIAVTSACGKSFALKDELAGRLVQCPSCGEEIRVPGGGVASTAPTIEGLDLAFARKKFLLRQKHLALSEKYYVWDEGGNTILFVQRPVHFFRSLLTVVGGVGTLALVWVPGFLLTSAVGEGAPQAILAVSTFVLGIVAMIAAIIALIPKRHVYFYRDDTKKELLLQVDQDKKVAFFVATYTVKDPAGTVLARLRKNYIYNILRKRWYCFTPKGELVSVIKEDSLLLSLLRRFLGPFFGLLRTNFVIYKGDSEEIVGEFNRKFTLLDRYVLDLTPDVEHYLDPRVALAIGVMLDTGERR